MVNRHGENTGERHECPICGETYTLYDSSHPHIDGLGKAFRFGDEWTVEEVEAHKLSHVPATRARKVLGLFAKLTAAEKQQVMKFLGLVEN